jgi:hypothetical protein
MSHIRFSVATLFVAVGFASLRESSDLGVSGAFRLTLDILVKSIRFAIHRTGSKRAYRLGVCPFGDYRPRFSQVHSIESHSKLDRNLSR